MKFTIVLTIHFVIIAFKLSRGIKIVNKPLANIFDVITLSVCHKPRYAI